MTLCFHWHYYDSFCPHQLCSFMLNLIVIMEEDEGKWSKDPYADFIQNRGQTGNDQQPVQAGTIKAIRRCCQVTG